MATLHDSTTILSGLSAGGIVGLTASSNENEVIVTKNRSVDIYKVGDTKALSSWSSKSSLQFTSPVIFSHSLNQFVGVYNQKSLVRWNYETTDLLKEKSVDVGSPINAVLALEGDPVTVFANGWVEGLSSVISHRRKQRTPRLQSSEKLLNQWIIPAGETSHVVLLTRAKKGYFGVIVSPTAEGGEILNRLTLSTPTEQQCVDSCMVHRGASSSLYILWLDGSVTLYELSGDVSEGSMVEGLKLLQLFSDEDMSTVRIASINEDFLAISGIRHVHSSSNTNSAHLTIWNTTFGTLHACTPLPDYGSSDREGGRQSLVHLHHHLFVATPASLSCHSYQCAGISLARALGKLSVGEPTVEATQQWSQDKMETGPSSQNIETTKSKVLTALLQPGKGKSTFKRDVQLLHTQSPSAILEILKAFSDKCTKKKGPLPGELLKPLIKSSKVAGSACPEFLSLVIGRADADLASLCLEDMQDLPEPFLVKCLELFLGLKPDSNLPSVNGSSNEELAQTCPVSPKQAISINKVLVCPFNTIFLLSSIKKLQFSSALLLLRYLDFLLVTGSFDDKHISEETLVDWTSVTLDAHFTQLVLTPAAKDVLTSLRKCVHQHVELYSEVNEVHRLVEAMRKATTERPPSSNAKESEGTYSVEILQLPV